MSDFLARLGKRINEATALGPNLQMQKVAKAADVAARKDKAILKQTKDQNRENQEADTSGTESTAGEPAVLAKIAKALEGIQKS